MSSPQPKVSVWYVLWWMGLITVLLSLIAYYIAIYCQQQYDRTLQSIHFDQSLDTTILTVTITNTCYAIP